MRGVSDTTSYQPMLTSRAVGDTDHRGTHTHEGASIETVRSLLTEFRVSPGKERHTKKNEKIIRVLRLW